MGNNRLDILFFLYCVVFIIDWWGLICLNKLAEVHHHFYLDVRLEVCYVGTLARERVTFAMSINTQEDFRGLPIKPFK
jgi:hypothetical protein